MSSQLVGVPWIVLGDFNEIISPAEHLTRGMRDFWSCVDSCYRFDLQYLGNSFTWSNYHVAKSLDSILTNDAWNQRFPAVIGVFGEQGFSYHSHACVFLDQHKLMQKQPFKLFVYLNQHVDFKEFIHATWS